VATIIDRRLNPAGKNFVNRQKFLRRAKENIKETIKRAVNDKHLKDIGNAENVKIRSKDLSEPSFRDDPETGNHRYVLPGNRQFSKGDLIPKPEKKKAGSKEGGQGDDFSEEFEFTLTRDEFLNYLFEDLELPDFVKQSIKGADTLKTAREGFTTSGSPANLNVEQTFKNSIGRRLALRRPSDEEVERVRGLLDSEKDEKKKAELLAELERLEGRKRIVPFIDETDLKYNLWVKKPHPKTKAVMFCLMDVSGSMGENEKDISKRFFLLLYLFLERKYDTVDIRFIRHTTHAEEVDEHTFFYDTQSGGTTISSGLECIDAIIEDEYNTEEWNLYVAQCTDGDNWSMDNTKCEEILIHQLLPKLQYFAYIEVSAYDRGGTIFEAFSAWPTYNMVAESHENLVCKRIKHQRNVWQVFRELFSV
jgi:uncharacterized sporulation protein YeaH/YhbH (DUF444 family)